MTDRLKWMIVTVIALLAAGSGAAAWLGLLRCNPPTPAPPPPIQVTEASYGLNCHNGMAGLATAYVQAECNGKVTCSFPVQKAASQIGDHCPGTPKDFRVSYVCGDKVKSTTVAPEAVGKPPT